MPKSKEQKMLLEKQKVKALQVQLKFSKNSKHGIGEHYYEEETESPEEEED